MKVESKNVIKMLQEVTYLLAGIYDTIKVGDDGFGETVISHTEDIKTIIRVFTIEHMTPKVVITDKKHGFLTRYNNDEKKVIYTDDEEMLKAIVASENKDIVKARLYLWLKREIEKIDVPVIMSENDAVSFVYDQIISGTSSEHWFFGTFQREADYVLSLAVSELYEARRRNPQLALVFDKITDKTPTGKLIDIL